MSVIHTIKNNFQNRQKIPRLAPLASNLCLFPAEALALSLVVLTLISALALSSPRVSADDSAINNVAITVPVSCTMSSTLDSAHTATIQNGIYTPNIGTTTLTFFCNDSEGFALYAIGYTNDEYGNTVLEGDTNSGSDIITGTATSGNTSNWAMKLSTDSAADYPLTLENGFDSYSAVPDEYTLVAKRESNTDQITGATLITTYATFINQYQLAGTYIGKVKYTLVYPNDASAPVAPLSGSDCPANSICYAPNANDIIGTMVSASTTEPKLTAISASAIAAKQTYAVDDTGTVVNITSNSAATLIAQNYKREGYGFAGWSTDFEATLDSTIYGPNETITTGDLSENGLILYPVWVASAGIIQDWGWSECDSLTPVSTSGNTLSSVTALTDARDGEVYAIARLADEQCWMIENLRLGDTAENILTLSRGLGGAFTGLAESEDENFEYSIVANSLYSINGSNGTNNIGPDNSPAYRMPRYNHNNTNIGGTNASGTSLIADHNTSSNAVQWYGYGNYYSWPAAIASTKSYMNWNVSEANTSICPAGWYLPTGKDANGVFGQLDVAIGGTGTGGYQEEAAEASNRWRSFPNNYVYSGLWGTAPAYGRGETGRYWSSSTTNYYYAYGVELSSISVEPGTYIVSNNNYLGESVRCVTFDMPSPDDESPSE